MAYEQRDNSGSLFPNKKKETENHPNLTGSIMVEGKMYWISGWVKKGTTDKWISLAVKPKDEQAPAKGVGGSAKTSGSRTVNDGDFDNDIPF